MTSIERRRSVRCTTDWDARYQLDVYKPWRDARIIDMSRHGAAVELFDVGATDTLAGRLQLAVSSIAGDDSGVRFPTWIRRRVRLEPRRVLVGVEFAPLRNDESALTELMIGLRAMA